MSGAVLPDMVPPNRLAAANALIGGFSSSANIVAPAIAGIIVAAVGPGAGFGCESALLAVTGTSIAAAMIPAIRHLRPAADSSVLGQLRTGWRVYVRLRWLWLLTLQWTAFSVLVLAPLAVIGPAIALEFLGGPAAWGVISSCLTVGVVAGQFAAGRLRSSRPLLVSAWLCPVGIAEALALGLGAPVLVIGLAAVISGLAMGMQFVIFQTTLQRTVPAPVLARVTAFDLLGSELGQPVGYALAGPVGAAVGLRAFVTAGAVISVAAVIPFTLARPLRERGEVLAMQAASSTEP